LGRRRGSVSHRRRRPREQGRGPAFKQPFDARQPTVEVVYASVLLRRRGVDLGVEVVDPGVEPGAQAVDPRSLIVEPAEIERDDGRRHAAETNPIRLAHHAYFLPTASSHVARSLESGAIEHGRHDVSSTRSWQPA